MNLNTHINCSRKQLQTISWRKSCSFIVVVLKVTNKVFIGLVEEFHATVNKSALDTVLLFVHLEELNDKFHLQRLALHLVHLLTDLSKVHGQLKGLRVMLNLALVVAGECSNLSRHIFEVVRSEEFGVSAGLVTVNFKFAVTALISTAVNLIFVGALLLLDLSLGALLLFFHLKMLTADAELLLDLLEGGNGTSLEPRVLLDLINRHALAGVFGKHALHQILELSRDWSLLLVDSPELLLIARIQESVVRIRVLCRAEWEVSRVHDEKNNGGSEKISSLAIIGAMEHLGSHVVLSTDARSKPALVIALLKIFGYTKVGNTQAVVGIKKDVVGFEIAMSESLSMDILQSAHQIRKEETRHFKWESSVSHDIID